MLSAENVVFPQDIHVIRIHDKQGPVAQFDPSKALGAGLDGHERGEVARMLSPANAREMMTAGLKPISYRLRTELAGEAWHWNPQGKFSDPKHKRGYWVSSTRSSRPILTSYGYKLPRRGNTHDQANDDGYSRLDDGDVDTFWKSNPYLDPYYTKQPMSEHPQWIAVDVQGGGQVDTIRVAWGVPYATEFHVEYSNSADIDEPKWTPIDAVVVNNGRTNQSDIHFHAVSARFIRLVMTAASGTAPAGSTDVRDRLGVAVREIYVRASDATGNFTDVVKHRADKEQTAIYVSSTDPWHRESDRDPRVEQPGFDLIYERGLDRGLPMLLAIPVLYDTPENAVAELQYLREHHRLIQQAELGEEPEEQWMMPEDYGALYEQWADALHGLDPGLQIGGTSMVMLDPSTVPDPSWQKRLVSYFAKRGRSKDLAFFSFEWYPFDEVCEPSAPQLAEATDLLKSALERVRSDGLTMPLIITEYGYSAYGTRAEVDLEGAMLNADTVGLFMTFGGSAAYLYGYEPNELLNDKGCTWGNNMLFGLNERGSIEYKTATYWAARMVAEEWTSPGGGLHSIYRAESDVLNADHDVLVPAYASTRPDGTWSLLLINKDPEKSFSIRAVFDDEGSFAASGEVVQFSRAQYVWKANGDDSRPEKSEPPVRTALDASGAVTLPPYSVTVVRGKHQLRASGL